VSTVTADRTVSPAQLVAVCEMLGLDSVRVREIHMLPTKVKVTLYCHNDKGHVYLNADGEPATERLIYDVIP
jgi:hypothetical protein